MASHSGSRVVWISCIGLTSSSSSSNSVALLVSLQAAFLGLDWLDLLLWVSSALVCSLLTAFNSCTISSTLVRCRGSRPSCKPQPIQSPMFWLVRGGTLISCLGQGNKACDAISGVCKWALNISIGSSPPQICHKSCKCTWTSGFEIPPTLPFTSSHISKFPFK